VTAEFRILLIDGLDAPRRLTGTVIQHAFPAVHLVEASDALALADALVGDQFSIAIAAPHLPWGNGTEVLREVRRNFPDCSTILFGAVDPDMLDGRILRGAVDAVLRNSSQGYGQLPALVRALSSRGGEVSYRRLETTPMSNGDPHDHANDERREEADVLTAMLVHDLQEPLALILQTVPLLASQFSAEPHQASARQLARITGSAERMQTMIDGLKSRAEAAMHAPSFDAVDLNEVLEAVIQHLKLRLEETDARILYSHLPEIVCDRTQIVQLIENLIANSLKFRGKEPPQITVQVVERAAEWLLSVSDNGIGISPADSERIFGIFQRLHTAEEYPGSGVGLAICKRIAENHSGDIWIQPNAGGGTSFYVSIAKRTNGPATAFVRA
jgi:signal transduction histidine kinase